MATAHVSRTPSPQMTLNFLPFSQNLLYEKKPMMMVSINIKHVMQLRNWTNQTIRVVSLQTWGDRTPLRFITTCDKILLPYIICHR